MIKNLIKSAAVASLLAMPMAANALTSTVEDADGNNAGVGPYSVTTSGATSEYFVNIRSFTSDVGSSFTEVFDFVNNSIYDFFVSVATLNTSGDFDNASLTVTGAGVAGSPLSLNLDGSSNVIKITSGSTATFTAKADVKGPGNFDISVAAIPLPAGGLLLLTALGGFGLIRRKTKA
ncbi:VPLPA-CTERM sorting domain-containing protein [Roseovarius aestuariivivens]|uniref:VPLPA-CTERM sorting domain-containing protein n=1 Tax=Roseovarius aestuariivivens TaxID=1888910 RepID=UPI00107FDF81|nr:VPLPA-CTERM sorting domain-containing protein [Roseovarius aestuariivivens]